MIELTGLKIGGDVSSSDGACRELEKLDGPEWARFILGGTRQLGLRARPDALAPLRRVRYWADRHGSPKHHLEYGSQSRNVDQVGHQLKFRQQKVGNETASGSSPITAGATLAPTGNKLTGTPCPYGREELLPIDARALRRGLPAGGRDPFDEQPVLPFRRGRRPALPGMGCRPRDVVAPKSGRVVETR